MPRARIHADDAARQRACRARRAEREQAALEAAARARFAVEDRLQAQRNADRELLADLVDAAAEDRIDDPDTVQRLLDLLDEIPRRLPWARVEAAIAAGFTGADDSAEDPFGAELEEEET